MQKIPLALCEKLIKEQGDVRVSEDAKFAFGEALEEYAEILASKAIMTAKHVGRKTVKGKDIRLVK